MKKIPFKTIWIIFLHIMSLWMILMNTFNILDLYGRIDKNPLFSLLDYQWVLALVLLTFFALSRFGSKEEKQKMSVFSTKETILVFLLIIFWLLYMATGLLILLQTRA